jgi:hypothetical protein
MKFTAWIEVDDRSGTGMQRWIALAAVVVLLLGVGGGALFWNHRRNRPDKVWVPLPLNPEAPEDARSKIVKQLDIELRKPSVLLGVATDVQLATKLDLSSTEAAVEELEKRMFVELGTADTAMGKVPSINVGVNGKSKEHDMLGQISVRLMQDVRRILGVKDKSAQSF